MGGPQSSTNEQQQLKTLMAALQQKNIAVLADLTSPQYGVDRKSFEKALENAHKLRCDGLHMSADAALFARARDVLGTDAIMGVDCGTSRHAAMQMGEAGADYVGFGLVETVSALDDQDHDLNKGSIETGDELFVPETLIEFVDWWQQLFEVPCVALDVADRTQIEELVKIGADFVAIGPGLWPALANNEELASNDELVTWLAKTCPVIKAGS
ncbi:MAG: thiamine phosphate synthase [bacterium]|nr:thiamine phosphate synthase [bacterium]